MIVDTSKQIQAKLLTGDSSYIPNYIFVEYRNVQDPESTVSDAVSESETIEHYNNLLSGSDYIAVPISIKPVYEYDENTDKYTVTYSTVIAGNTEGVNGEPFTTRSNSLIYSFGLVTRVPTTYGHEDILFARTVLPTTKQILKVTNDMYVSWKLDL